MTYQKLMVQPITIESEELRKKILRYRGHFLKKQKANPANPQKIEDCLHAINYLKHGNKIPLFFFFRLTGQSTNSDFYAEMMKILVSYGKKYNYEVYEDNDLLGIMHN